MQTRILIISIAAALFAAGLWLGGELRRDGAGPRPGSALETRAATVLRPARPLPAVDLVNADGEAFSTESLNGHWTLLFMGFTNCGHVCPTTLLTLDDAVQRSGTPVDVLFVSVDPERDSPDVIKAYVEAFNPDFQGVTGTAAELDRLAAALGAPYFISRDDGRYLVDHSSAVFLINPGGEFQAVFGAPHSAESMAADLRTITARPAA